MYERYHYLLTLKHHSLVIYVDDALKIARAQKKGLTHVETAEGLHVLLSEIVSVTPRYPNRKPKIRIVNREALVL